MKIPRAEDSDPKTPRRLCASLSEAAKSLFTDTLKRASAYQAGKRPADKEEEIAECPHCGSELIKKNGRARGRQRWLCTECGKTFGAGSGTILHHTRKSLDVWGQYVECMAKKLPLRKCAKTCGISLSTAFAWRHKILKSTKKPEAEPAENPRLGSDEVTFS